jgi:hypothetical protein
MAIPPSSGAVREESFPLSYPIGVLLAATIKTYLPTAVLNAYLIALIYFN